MFLAISGGGIRAAAFSYGVIDELQKIDTTAVSETCQTRPCSILGNLSYISGVSGGAFTAAYYALSLSDPVQFPLSKFRERILYRDHEAAVLSRIILPFPDPLVKLANRSYVAGAYYQAKLFANKNFRDLEVQGGGGNKSPFLIINATELVTGRRFMFTQEQFRCLGSSVGDFPIGYAVAASAALPVAFSPIRLDNYMRDPDLCFSDLDYGGLAESEAERVHPLVAPHRDPTQSTEVGDFILRERYLDQMNTAYLYLSDGGIADNLGIQAFVDLRRILIPGLYNGSIKGIVVISVNAATTPVRSTFGRNPDSPGFIDVLSRTSDLFLQRGTASSQDEVTRGIGEIEKALQAVGKRANFICMDISFNSIEDDSVRLELNAIPTRLRLSKREVDTLIGAGRFIVSKKARELLAIRALLENPDQMELGRGGACSFGS